MSVHHIATLRTAIVPRSTITSKVALVCGGVAFLAVMAQISLPIPGSPVPVTGQTLAVLLLGAAYGANLGATTLFAYLSIGVAGAPIFAQGTHGWSRVYGATGGYLVGMVITSYLVGYLAERKWDQRIATVIPTMILGNVVTFSLGLFWLHQYTGQGWAWTFSAGLSPFILGEVIKIAIASTALPSVWRFVSKR